MKTTACLLALLAITALAQAAPAPAPTPLFDGKTFEGWEGDTEKTWRIVDGAVVGGSLETTVPRNEFLATKKAFTNFDLRLKFKLLGKEGLVNAGVQFRSERIPDNFEMIGYQADLGEGYYGSIYDESRRNKILAAADKDVLAKTLKVGEWNEYPIRCEGPRIQLWINGVQTVDYTEPDAEIARSGLVALQIHGGGIAEVSYKDIMIEELAQ